MEGWIQISIFVIIYLHACVYDYIQWYLMLYYPRYISVKFISIPPVWLWSYKYMEPFYVWENCICVSYLQKSSLHCCSIFKIQKHLKWDFNFKKNIYVPLNKFINFISVTIYILACKIIIKTNKIICKCKDYLLFTSNSNLLVINLMCSKIASIYTLYPKIMSLLLGIQINVQLLFVALIRNYCKNANVHVLTKNRGNWLIYLYPICTLLDVNMTFSILKNCNINVVLSWKFKHFYLQVLFCTCM